MFHLLTLLEFKTSNVSGCIFVSNSRSSIRKTTTVLDARQLPSETAGSKTCGVRLSQIRYDIFLKGTLQFVFRSTWSQMFLLKLLGKNIPNENVIAGRVLRCELNVFVDLSNLMRDV